MNLTEREFLGRILSDKDPKHQGRYKVHIPNLMPHISDDSGIWVKNHIHKNRNTPSDSGVYGQYFPLQPNTYVKIKFFENDYNTGFVDSIVSDYEIETLPLKIKDRDDFYQLIRTPKYNNIFTIHEDTTDQAPNSIHLYFNQYRTTIILDEEGIHIHTSDNQDTEIDKDEDHYVHENRRRTVDKNEEILIKKNHKIYIKGSHDIAVDGETKIFSTGTCDIRSSSTINCDAPTINLNGGKSSFAVKNKGCEIPERKTTFNERSEKSDDTNTRMIVEEDGGLADYDFFKR